MKSLSLKSCCAALLAAGMSLPALADPVAIGVVGDSLSAEYRKDYEPNDFLLSLTETFGMGALSTQTDCSGGNFGADILEALLDAIMPLVPMITDLPSRNWVQQLALLRASSVTFGPYTDNPNLYGEPRLRGYEYNFARVSGTVLEPGLGNHEMEQQIDAILPYVSAGTLDAIVVMVGSNDLAARELKQQSFCDSSWFDFQDDLIATLFGSVDRLRTAGATRILIAELPLGTAAGIAQGIVLQRINETNVRIRAEAAARGLPTLDVWRFNQDPNRVNPLTGVLSIGPYTVAPNSVASINDAVQLPTAGNGVAGACTAVGKCGTLATTLSYISSDKLHPGTVPQGLIANEIVAALNAHFGFAIAPLTDVEILEAGGTLIPVPAKVSDASKWTQIRQRGTNKCLTVRDDNSNMTVASCSSSNVRQQWYVVPYDGGYQLRSAITAANQLPGQCVYDDGWRYKLASCSADKTRRFSIYGGGADRNWFIKAQSRDSCLYQYNWYEGGNTYGSLGNCGLSWGWDYMRWGFHLRAGSAVTVTSAMQ